MSSVAASSSPSTTAGSFLLRGLTQSNIRVVAADTTALVQTLTQRHDASPTAAAALGRMATAGALLCHVLLKNARDRITLRIDGGGPLGNITIDAGLDGDIRGFVRHPHVSLPLRSDGKLNVGAGVGTDGDFQVLRSVAPNGEIYTSSVPITTGEIAEDVSTFLAVSEQINSAVLLGVHLDATGITHAGGVLLQALPEAEDAALTVLEANIRALGPLTTAMQTHSLEHIMAELCWGLGLDIMTPEPLPLHFFCSCDEARILHALTYFSPAERQAMIAEDGGAEAICHWCNTRYWITPEQLQALGTLHTPGTFTTAADSTEQTENNNPEKHPRPIN